jgi:tRNA pseudouridine synthase 10
MDDRDRGRALKVALTMHAHLLHNEGNEEGIKALRVLAENGRTDVALMLLRKLGFREELRRSCYICEDVFDKLDEVANLAVNLLSNYEYDTFLVGVELPMKVAEREDELKSEFKIRYGESIKSELSREIGKKIQAITEKRVDHRRPDVVVIVDPFKGTMRLQINPVYIAGRYRKLVRGMPQCKWICVRCGGTGCERCNWTGKMYEVSVEELICEPISKAFSGTDYAFHAAGREDVDARMLGGGRPFVVEVKEPRVRRVDLRVLEKRVNEGARGLVEVRELKYVSGEAISRLKEGEGTQKIYDVLVKFDREISREKLRELESKLKDAVIEQRTPLRVAHRRADKVRRRRVYEVRCEMVGKGRARLTIRCDGGLYIKELVNGDHGRTRPSVSEILKVKAEVIQLDVLDVLLEIW